MMSRRLTFLAVVAALCMAYLGHYLMTSLSAGDAVVDGSALQEGRVRIKSVAVDGGDVSAYPHVSSAPKMVGGETTVAAASSAMAEKVVGRHGRYLNDPLTGAFRGNKRCIVPLLLTDAKYHGTRLLATTLKGWIQKLFTPQETLDLVIYYDVQREGLVDDIVGLLRVRPASDSLLSTLVGTAASFEESLRPEVAQYLSAHDRGVLEPTKGYFLTPYSDTILIRIIPTVVPFPQYIQKEPELLNRSDWLRCGCPPYCPVKRATVGYVQGTRWYTYDLFLEPTIAPYSYWMKVDVDIWMFRELGLNIVDEMISKRALAAHTGVIYNGNGCSNDLHRAIMEFYSCPFERIAHQKQNKRETICEDSRIVSAKMDWWKQDDGVYYTNFVVYSVPFFMDKEVMALSLHLNEYRDGFFRWRWTDQSLAHKVFGVFAGPDEDDFRLDWTHMRWKRGSFRANASFWHGKSSKSRKDLAKYTRL